MTWRAAVLLIVAATACKERSPDVASALEPPGSAAPVDVPRPLPPPANAAAPAAPAAPVAAPGTDEDLALPAEIGPPPPFDQVRRYQKRSEVLATLGSTIRELQPDEEVQHRALITEFRSLTTSSSEPVYATPDRDVVMQFSFSDGRLTQMQFASATALEPLVLSRWGAGEEKATPGFVWRSYPASSAGWSATLAVFGAPGKATSFAVLSLSVAAGAEHTPDAPGQFKMFADVGALIGQPLANGARVFGDAFVTEIADEPPGAAEQTEARQGYADVTLPWSASEWTTVLRVDQQTGKVVQATIEGETDEYEERVELMKQLKAAFGAPKPVITDAGYLRVAFATKTLVVTLTDDDPRWTIEIHQR